MTKSLYIHLPFCKSFCSYCDFKRGMYKPKIVDLYLKQVVNCLKKKYAKNSFKTIYLGGGTPNCLSNQQLEYLLKNLKNKIDKNYEFTIECNPEFITKKQAEIFKRNNVNRISLGIQTLNKEILKKVNRHNPQEIVENALTILKKQHLNNISCDLIYGFNNQTKKMIKYDLDFLFKHTIKHISCYSLEIKPHSTFGKQKYQTDDITIEKHLEFIIKYLKQHGYKRYEVSNWAKQNKYQSKHNVATWLTQPWAAIGYGAYGFENGHYYFYHGTRLKWKLSTKKLSKTEKYQQVLMMGLRLQKGLCLKNKLYFEAYTHFKKQLESSNLFVKQNNYIKCRNLNLLDELLIKFF